MNQALEQLAETISGRFAGHVARVDSRCGELTFEVAPAALLTAAGLLFPLLLVIMPTLFGSFYASYRDVFGPQGNA